MKATKMPVKKMCCLNKDNKGEDFLVTGISTQWKWKSMIEIVSIGLPLDYVKLRPNKFLLFFFHYTVNHPYFLIAQTVGDGSCDSDSWKYPFS